MALAIDNGFKDDAVSKLLDQEHNKNKTEPPG